MDVFVIMRHRLGAIFRRLGSTAKTSLAAVGLGTSLYLSYDLNQYRKLSGTKENHLKNVLVLPFHRMTIVEQKKPSPFSKLSSFSSEDKIMEVEIHELVDVIHKAANDPNIHSIYATFGHGFGFKCGGFAHIEEIRDAVRIFNESHRRHKNGRGERNDESESPIIKCSYAFADTFDNPLDSANKEYFLASAFSQINLQPRGNIHLYGVSLQNIFLADSFKKYGIKASVFRHGIYKNAGSIFTDKDYTKAHLENNRALVQSINNVMYNKISESRRFPKEFNRLWQAIHDYGTMSADDAQEIGLVDQLPHVNPLYDLIKIGRGDGENIDALKTKWSALTGTFSANNLIDFSSYKQLLLKRRAWDKQKIKLYQTLKHMSDRSTAFEALVRAFGYDPKYFGFDKESVDHLYSKPSTDKIAVIHVNGTIMDKTAKQVTKALREIKDDKTVKCIVLRIDSPGGAVTASETILEECKDSDKPIICSFSNLAASGGYYISTHADRIFSQPTTLTGSIGVLSLKFDATEFAKRHGINAGFVTSSPHAQTYNLLQPLTNEKRKNLERYVDRVYWYFKKIVAEGRNLSIKEVNQVAGGRVWTGIEAKEIGLVDELGGLDRALNYAKDKFASENAQVLTYPKQKSFVETMFKNSNTSHEMTPSESIKNVIFGEWMKSIVTGFEDMGLISFLSHNHVTLCMDEKNAIEMILKEAFDRDP